MLNIFELVDDEGNHAASSWTEWEDDTCCYPGNSPYFIAGHRDCLEKMIRFQPFFIPFAADDGDFLLARIDSARLGPTFTVLT